MRKFVWLVGAPVGFLIGLMGGWIGLPTWLIVAVVLVVTGVFFGTVQWRFNRWKARFEAELHAAHSEAYRRGVERGLSGD
jgi:protein-S-isoprenylcysteine O-methyltransferase Ste14